MASELLLWRGPCRAWRGRLVAPILAAALAVTGVASAEPNAADKETARGLMSAGRADRAKGDLQGALKAFTAADAIMHVPTTALEVARSQEALGLLVEARDTALQVARAPAVAREPGPFKAARDAASALSEELEARIPSLTITVTNVPEGATPTLTIDGASVPSETMGQPRKLDPGHHVVLAKAGKAERKQETELAERDAKTVTIELPAQGAVATAETEPASDAAHVDASGAPGKRSTLTNALLFGGFGVAGVGIVVGSITGAMSLSKTSNIKSSSACAGNVCNPSEDGDIGSARTMATVSTVSFVAAGVGAVAGVVGLLMGKSSPAAVTNEQPAALRVEPTFGLGRLEIGMRGVF